MPSRGPPGRPRPPSRSPNERPRPRPPGCAGSCWPLVGPGGDPLRCALGPGPRRSCTPSWCWGWPPGSNRPWPGLAWAAAAGWVLEGSLRLYPHLGGHRLRQHAGLPPGLRPRPALAAPWPLKPYWGRQAVLVLVHTLLVHAAVAFARRHPRLGHGLAVGPCSSPRPWATVALRLHPPPAPEVAARDPDPHPDSRGAIGVMKTLTWFMVLWAAAGLWPGAALAGPGDAEAGHRPGPEDPHHPRAPRGIVYDRNGNKLVDNRRALHLVIQYEDLPRGPPARSRPLALGPGHGPGPSPAPGRRHPPGGGQTACWCSRTIWTRPTWPGPKCCGPAFPFLSIEGGAPAGSTWGRDLAGHAPGLRGRGDPRRDAAQPWPLPAGARSSAAPASRRPANDRLKGVDGQRRILVDYLGREVATYGTQEAIPGRSVLPDPGRRPCSR